MTFMRCTPMFPRGGRDWGGYARLGEGAVVPGVAQAQRPGRVLLEVTAGPRLEGGGASADSLVVGNVTGYRGSSSDEREGAALL